MPHDHFPGFGFGPKTMVELLRRRASTTGLDVCFRFLVDGENEEEVMTFGELDRRARQVAAWLQSHGMQGQRALLLYPAGLDFIVAFFGCLYAGVVAVPAYPPRMNRKMDRIDAIAADAEAAVALTTQATLERVQQLLEQTPDLKKLLWLATDHAPKRIEDQWDEPEISGDTLAFLQYTSGSTGTPKGVMLTHSNLAADCGLITHAFELTRSGMGVFWLPSYHDMGLVGGIIQPLYMGRPNVLMSPMAFLQRPYRWLQAISKYHGTISGGPNFAYDLCVRKITPEQRSKLDLSSWSLAFNGAEPVRPETIDRFSEMFEPCGFRREAFYPCYGLAEATLLVSGGLKSEPPVVRAYDSKALENGEIVSVPQSEPGARRLVSAGQTLPNERIVIVHPETRMPSAPNEVGEIWVTGPTIAKGYWRRPEETEYSFRAQIRDTNEGPYLRTGDLGFFQGAELFIAGRLKDLIIIRGLNHYPHDIELTVENSHPAVRPSSAAAVAIDDQEESRLVVVCELERTAREDVEEVCAAIRRNVSREHELPVSAIRLLKPGSVPKTSSGKIQRHACRNMFLQGTLDVVAAWDAGGDDSTTTVTAPERAIAPETARPPKLEPTWSNDRAWQAAGGDDANSSAGLEAAAATAGNGAARRGKKRSTADQVLEAVQRIAKERARGLTLDTNITELGLDSLERMEILAALEERFGGRFP
ncbi:MAG TPA: AMP-binding protein, partial [Pirellulales bacterium]|nr:AMP-binding protein [Pirellulales bacterium]